MLKAYDQLTGKEIKQGDTVTDFRGDKWLFIRASRARTEYKSGKVIIEDGSTFGGEYYDKVFNIIVKEEKSGG